MATDHWWARANGKLTSLQFTKIVFCIKPNYLNNGSFIGHNLGILYGKLIALHSNLSISPQCSMFLWIHIYCEMRKDGPKEDCCEEEKSSKWKPNCSLLYNIEYRINQLCMSSDKWVLGLGLCSCLFLISIIIEFSTKPPSELSKPWQSSHMWVFLLVRSPIQATRMDISVCRYLSIK